MYILRIHIELQIGRISVLYGRSDHSVIDVDCYSLVPCKWLITL